MSDEGPENPLPDATLRGYLERHDRPPAFEGSDGHPYTVSTEVDRSGTLRDPYEGYLVFPRWAATGLGVVGHVETPTLATGASREAVESELGALTLHRLKELLEQALIRGAADHEPTTTAPHPSSIR